MTANFPVAVTRSLRFRLLAGAAVWIALALSLAGIVLADLFEAHVRARIEAELTHHLDQLAAGLEAGADGAVELVRPLSDPRFQRPLSGLYWQVEGLGAEPLRSRSLWDAVLPLPADSLSDGEVHRHTVAGPQERRLVVLERRVFLPEATAPLRLAVALDGAELDGLTASFNRTLVRSLAVLWAVLTVAAVVQVRVGLRPLAHLRRHLAAVRAGDARRLPQGMPTEVRPLVDDLNAVLDHNEAVVARARVQAGNLAHALKTDLAVLGNEVEALAAGPSGPAPDGLVHRIERMTRHIDHHMARARAAASSGVPGVRTPLASAVDRLVRTMARLYAERDLAFEVAVPPDLVFAGDPQDFDEMLGNLLDNACKWARRRVRVTGREGEGNRLIVAVEDDGPGLPPEHHAAALVSGGRLDESVPGSGLGLAVVRDLVDLYAGALRLTESDLGGLRVEMRLPAIRPDLSPSGLYL